MDCAAVTLFFSWVPRFESGVATAAQIERPPSYFISTSSLSDARYACLHLLFKSFHAKKSIKNLSLSFFFFFLRRNSCYLVFWSSELLLRQNFVSLKSFEASVLCVSVCFFSLCNFFFSFTNGTD